MSYLNGMKKRFSSDVVKNPDPATDLSIPPLKGVYVLLLRLETPLKTSIGFLGPVELPCGIYAYVGSARGPGGLRARVSRHLGKVKSLKWHIDYVTSSPQARIEALVYAETLEDLEAPISMKLGNSLCFKYSLKGFGSTDKRSETHLFKCMCSLEECVREASKTLQEFNLKVKTCKL
ncbi:MAG: GIY-YIG nuclease family protein [Thermoprotei archaeon]|nr:GIY-YIG nuclease family protein [Thermoprotei archaeon]